MKTKTRRAKTAIFPDFLIARQHGAAPDPMPRVRALVALASIAFLIAVTPALGKDKKDKGKNLREYAVMIGTVYGKDQRPLYGAKIKIRRLDQKKGKYELISDHNGEFAQRVPPG